jgi:uncharacterized protein YcfJ
MSAKFILPAVIAASMLSGCATYGRSNYNTNNDGWGYYDTQSYKQYGSYDYNSPDPRYNGYYADHYYRTDRRYRERQMNNNDRVYRGQNRRSDGTTGLIVGGLAGGVLGNIIAPGDSKTLGTVIGAVGGAVAGRAIDSRVRCR